MQLTNNLKMKLPYYYQKHTNMHGDSSMLVFIRRHYESKVLKIVAQAMVLALLITVLHEVVIGGASSRKLDESTTFVAMRKTTYATTTTTTIQQSTPSSSSSSSIGRKLLEFLSEEKKAILGNLEDVLLEPPRSSTGKSKAYLRKTKFLPDLLNDSLEGYSRRVYIDVGGGHGSTRWFEQNYPTRNKDFDIYRIETVPETEVDQSDDAWEGPPTQMGISDWLWRNVKAEEYVVMKAEAEVVEEMLKSKAIVLVDELFLECKPFGKGGRSKRAYWECLALYGRLRDFGVAVHQWWG